jgi:hypothetical protein
MNRITYLVLIDSFQYHTLRDWTKLNRSISSSSRFSSRVSLHQDFATRQWNKVVHILRTWFAASAPHHNIKEFMNVGLIPVEQDGDSYLRVRGPCRPEARCLQSQFHQAP